MCLTAILKCLCCYSCCWAQKPNTEKKTNQIVKPKKSTKTAETQWETLTHKKSLTPSQISDSKFTPIKKFKDKIRGEHENASKFDTEVMATEKYEILQNTTVKGGYGEVYQIKHKETGKLCAVKVMDVTKVITDNRFEIFKNETFILRRNPHKNIIELIHHFIAIASTEATKAEFSYSYMIMEFANSGDLHRRIKSLKLKKVKNFSESQSKRYFVQMSNAISYLHLNGIIHGDLKLDNILITIINGKEVIKVSDFGCSRVVYREKTGLKLKTSAVGTRTHMAPEILKVYICVNLNKPKALKKPLFRYNPLRGDVWALGICLFELLCFRRPFKTPETTPESILEIISQMKRGFGINKEISDILSDECKNLLIDLLQYDRNKRLDMKNLMRHQWVMSSEEYLNPSTVKHM